MRKKFLVVCLIVFCITSSVFASSNYYNKFVSNIDKWFDKYTDASAENDEKQLNSLSDKILAVITNNKIIDLKDKIVDLQKDIQENIQEMETLKVNSLGAVPENPWYKLSKDQKDYKKKIDKIIAKNEKLESEKNGLIEDFKTELNINGIELNDSEIAQLLNGTYGDRLLELRLTSNIIGKVITQYRIEIENSDSPNYQMYEKYYKMNILGASAKIKALEDAIKNNDSYYPLLDNSISRNEENLKNISQVMSGMTDDKLISHLINNMEVSQRNIDLLYEMKDCLALYSNQWNEMVCYLNSYILTLNQSLAVVKESGVVDMQLQNMISIIDTLNSSMIDIGQILEFDNSDLIDQASYIKAVLMLNNEK